MVVARRQVEDGVIAVGNAGVAHLKGLKHLSYLGIASTQVSDDGVVHLEHLKQLRSLYVNRTKVTGAGVEQLQRSLPKCRIYR